MPIERGFYVHDAPMVEVSNGLVHVQSISGDFVMLPSTFRAFVERGRRTLAEFEAGQREVVPLRQEGGG